VAPPVSQHRVDVSPFACGGAAQVVFVDGVATPASVAAAAALFPPGVTLAHLSALTKQQAAAVLLPLASGHPSAAFDALNAVCCQDPLCLLLPPGLSADHVPLHLLHVSATTAAPGADGLPCAQPRVLVHLGAGAAATVVEEFTCTPDAASVAAASAAASSKAPVPVCAVNACFHAALDAKAVLTHGRVSLLSGAVPQVGLTTVAQAEGSSYSLVSGCVAGMLSRHDVAITQGGPGTVTSQQAFVLAAGPSAAGELHTRLQLDHPDGTAKQLHKCIAAVPGAKCVFNGGVTLHRAAQRTDAQQLSRALLLAPRATVHAKPTLQINGDVFKCSHGCSVADLSGDELFYFMARGIDADAARDALVYSFAAEVVDQLPASVAPVAARLRAAVRAELAQAQQKVKERV
jgi:Fe-S cluster assembly protein SufD